MRGDLAAPGAVTVLVTGDEALDDNVLRLLEIFFGPKTLCDGMSVPVIRPLSDLLGRTHDNSHLRLSDLNTTLRDEIELGRPMVFVTPIEAAWPDILATLSATTCSLPSVDQRILSEMLRVLYSASPDHQAPDTLPDDRTLARLGLEDLIVLFRSPNAAVGWQRLVTHLAPTPVETRGPGLARFPMPREVREAVDQILADLRDWRAGCLPWSDVSQGLLLAGPPGCGKTEIPRLLGRDAGIPVIPASLARLHSTGARSSDVLREMRSLFAKAAADAPAIVFIDELDAFGDRGRPHDHNSSWTDAIVGGLLECLDGFETTEGVVTIAATNHPAKIDAALRRPGRFDRLLFLGPPSPDELPKAFRWHLGPDLADIDLTPFVIDAIGLTGAEIARIVRTARAKARTAKRPMILDDLRTALAEDHPPLSPALRHRVAIHEAGHALVATATGRSSPKMLLLHTDGGWTQRSAVNHVADRTDLEAELAALLAGRAAETLVLGTASPGSGGAEESDLARATGIAAALEISFGLGAEIVWRGTPAETKRHLAVDPQLRGRVVTHLERAAGAAMRILEANRRQLETIAGALEARGILNGPELDALLAPVARQTDMNTQRGRSNPSEPEV